MITAKEAFALSEQNNTKKMNRKVRMWWCTLWIYSMNRKIKRSIKNGKFDASIMNLFLCFVNSKTFYPLEKEYIKKYYIDLGYKCYIHYEIEVSWY